MTVYFIRGADMVKIGTTIGSVEQRLAGLQTGSPVSLSVIRTVAGGKRVEAWFHILFSDLRAQGEWFRYSDEMLSAEPPANLAGADGAETSARDTEWRQMESEWLSGLASNAAAVGLSVCGYLDREYQKWAASAAGQRFFRRQSERRERGQRGRG